MGYVVVDMECQVWRCYGLNTPENTLQISEFTLFKFSGGFFRQIDFTVNLHSLKDLNPKSAGFNSPRIGFTIACRSVGGQDRFSWRLMRIRDAVECSGQR